MNTPVLNVLAAIAIEGGREILDVYASDFAAVMKPDASPVTEADLRSEAAIARRLAELFPETPVVAEEAVAQGFRPGGTHTFFLVDPLDGTKEFLERNGDFTVNIAFVRRGMPVAGVVYAPALGWLWMGSQAEGAFEAPVENGVMGPRSRIRVREAPERIVAVGSRSHGDAKTSRWLGRFPQHDLLGRGSSLKFCLVARGEADLYPRLGRTMEWDTAAGDAVLQAAGGVVMTLGGQRLGYAKREQPGEAPFANPSFVAFGDPSLVERVRIASQTAA